MMRPGDLASSGWIYAIRTPTPLHNRRPHGSTTCRSTCVHCLSLQQRYAKAVAVLVNG